MSRRRLADDIRRGGWLALAQWCRRELASPCAPTWPELYRQLVDRVGPVAAGSVPSIRTLQRYVRAAEAIDDTLRQNAPHA